MFGTFKDKKMAKSVEFDTNTITTISIGTVLKGDISTEGDFRIVGKLVGSIRSTGKVVVGQNGVIEGDIYCQNADFSGTIKGNAVVENLLLLKSSVNMNGNIKTNKLSIESGANFNGNCEMSSVDSKSSNENKQDQKNLNAYVKYSSLAIQMGLIIGLGMFGGFQLDKFIRWQFPIFTLLLSLGAVAMAIYIAIKDFLKK